MEDIEIGDVVCLKSGGFNMTVSALDEDVGKASCVWMNGTGELQTASFWLSLLTKLY
jgi:uncharacterized protein YodC (DUF2158 family)